ncbi:MFS transporter [Streptomyces sp. P9(2023)]|uniref:MFS transporter n=1 Tax=Streptomyces sp. P9(2023) TaxID=3064394 RepID=UPI0028F3E998|nr:MFS transporter [Streptomyces sp. P9(2023)]MDT9687983.1 MFS transporter [Streptomyces sp. P9(2023)]
MLLTLGPVLLPEYRNPDAGRVDLVSAGLSFIAMLSAIYGIKEMPKHGPEPVSVMAVVAGVVVGYVFVRRQRTLTHPLLDLTMFRHRAFSASLTILLLTMMFLMGNLFLIAQFLQSVLALSPLETGLWLLPPVLCGMVAALAATGIVRRVRPAYVFGAGMTVAAGGFVILWGASADSGPGPVVVAAILMFVGITPVAALGADMIVGSAPPEQAGPAAALSETSNEFGGALGIALVGSLATAVFRGSMADAYPKEVPAGAEDTLAGALEVAAGLSGEAGAALAAAARAAFADGLQISAIVGAPLMLVLAVGAALMLRQVTPAAHEPGDEPTGAEPAEPAEAAGPSQDLRYEPAKGE